MENEIIELSKLTKKYGAAMVVDQLNLCIKKGEIFGLLGPNGAGKSTTIRMILGLTEPSSGSVKVCGISSTSNPIQVKRKVGYLPEDVGFYNSMTGLENLMFTARLNEIPEKEAKEQALELLEKVGLSDVGMKKTGIYSRGMRQRLVLADTLIKRPEVIILDEPTLGIDPKGVKEFLNQIVELSRKEKITVLFSSHNLYQVQQVCDRVGLFVKGRLIAEGNLQTLSKKLFSSSPYVFEARLAPLTISMERQINGSDHAELVETLKQIDSVRKVKLNNSTCLIESSVDISPLIAKTIINRDYSLYALHKKEFSLDDIYAQYFEGGVDHE